ncbi:MAG TPA: methyltransferase [Bacteroidia bacterium]|nr:methyltransferase [Bacteroidia bacterium]
MYSKVAIKKYILEKEKNVYYPEGAELLFGYSDGDAVEEKLFEIISKTNDLRIGSTELHDQISDWPSKYHLSSLRVDLMRPLVNVLKGNILEIGSGCGSITRYLGETGSNVWALEGSKRRASITSARCRDLKNVKVFCDNFSEFETDQRFDVVTMIGVLEYSQVYIDSENPIKDVLEKAKSFLKPQGVLIIAIENQLGLKYIAGAPEDHLGEKYIGVENRYAKKGPITFGKKILKKHLENSGFLKIDFLYPFPDYKFPSAIVTENGCNNSMINLPDILKSKIKYIQSEPYISSFNEEKALSAIVQNELIDDLSNSFLVVAGIDSKEAIQPEILAYTYSNQRRKEFCKQNKFIVKNNECWVLQNKIYPNANVQLSLVDHILKDEKYLSGTLFINYIQSVLETKDWSYSDVFTCARPWMDFLTSKAGKKEDKDNMPLLDGLYFDAAPFNVLVSEDGKLFDLIDLEWKIKQDLRLDYVIFRSLYYSFSSISTILRSENVHHIKIADVVFEILKLYFKNRKIKDNSSLIKLENQILEQILGTAPKNTFESQLVYREYNGKEETKQQQLNANYSLDQIVIEPIKNTRLQIYWADENCSFSEEKSSFQLVQLQEYNQQFTFNIHSTTGQIEFLRFDIGCQFGFLIIHSIKIRTKNANILWNWNSNDILQKNDCLLIENEEHFKGLTIQLATSNDPYFLIRLSKESPSVSYTELEIELNLSSLTTDQIHLLNNQILKPLSFISIAEVKATDFKLQLAEDERNKLIEKSNWLSGSIDTLKSENDFLKNAVSVSNETNHVYANDKKELLRELNEKSEIINKIFSEKEKLEQQCSQLKMQTTQLEHKLTESNEEQGKIQNQITILEALKIVSAQEKKNILDEKNKVDKVVSEMLDQKAKLTQTINDQFVFIQEMKKNEERLDREKGELLTKIGEKEQILNELIIRIKENESAIRELGKIKENLESMNSRYKEQYENKSWLQIAWNRISNKK